MRHNEDLVRLWATGELSLLERIRVEWHLRRCAPCRRIAEETLATIASLSAVLPSAGPLPPLDLEERAGTDQRAQARLRVAAACAAIIVLLAGNLALYGRVRTLESERARLAVAQRALVTGDYQRIEMHVADRTALTAGRVFCARSGRWIYVVVDGRGTYDVWVRRDGWRRVGETSGEVASLYVRLQGKPREVALTLPGATPQSALATAHPPKEMNR